MSTGRQYNYARLQQDAGAASEIDEHSPLYYQSSDHDPTSATAPLLPDSARNNKEDAGDSDTEELMSEPDGKDYRHQSSPSAGFFKSIWMKHQRHCVILGLLAIATVGTIAQYAFVTSSHHQHHHHQTFPFLSPMTDLELDAIKQQLREHTQKILLEHPTSPTTFSGSVDASPFVCQNAVPGSVRTEIPKSMLPSSIVLDSHLVKLETFDDNLAMNIKIVSSAEVDQPLLRVVRGHVQHGPPDQESSAASLSTIQGLVFKMEKKKHRHHRSKTTKVKVKLMLANSQNHQKQIAHCQRIMAEQGLSNDPLDNQDKEFTMMEEQNTIEFNTFDRDNKDDQSSYQYKYEHKDIDEEEAEKDSNEEFRKLMKRRAKHGHTKGKDAKSKVRKHNIKKQQKPKGAGFGIAIAEAHHHHGPSRRHHHHNNHGHSGNNHHSKGHSEHCSCFFTNLGRLTAGMPTIDTLKNDNNLPSLHKPCVSLDVELLLPTKLGNDGGDNNHQHHKRHHHAHGSGNGGSGICSLDFEGPHMSVHMASNDVSRQFSFKNIHIRNKVGAIRLRNVRAEHLHINTDQQGLIMLHRMMARRRKRQPVHDELRAVVWPQGPVKLRITEKGRKRVILDAVSGQTKMQSELPRGCKARFSIHTVGMPCDVNGDVLSAMIASARSM